MKRQVVEFRGKSYELFLLTKEEWLYKMKNTPKRGSKFWWFRMFFPKQGKVIYPRWVAIRVAAIAYIWGIGKGFIHMRDNVWFAKKMHIRHEIGHILGYDHKWYPECMNPTRFFRWFIKKSLWGKIKII